jgi:hypothetical protein
MQQHLLPNVSAGKRGPWFTILGVVFTDKWIIQRLTDFDWAGLDATLNELHYNRVARIMYSLRRKVEKLREYYFGLEIIPTCPNDILTTSPPFARTCDEDDSVIEFKYIQPLEIESTCLTLPERLQILDLMASRPSQYPRIASASLSAHTCGPCRLPTRCARTHADRRGTRRFRAWRTKCGRVCIARCVRRGRGRRREGL